MPTGVDTTGVRAVALGSAAEAAADALAVPDSVGDGSPLMLGAGVSWPAPQAERMQARRAVTPTRFMGKTMSHAARSV